MDTPYITAYPPFPMLAFGSVEGDKILVTPT